jgi:hypothetical protein
MDEIWGAVDRAEQDVTDAHTLIEGAQRRGRPVTAGLYDAYERAVDAFYLACARSVGQAK